MAYYVGSKFSFSSTAVEAAHDYTSITRKQCSVVIEPCMLPGVCCYRVVSGNAPDALYVTLAQRF